MVIVIMNRRWPFCVSITEPLVSIIDDCLIGLGVGTSFMIGWYTNYLTNVNPCEPYSIIMKHYEAPTAIKTNDHYHYRQVLSYQHFDNCYEPLLIHP